MSSGKDLRPVEAALLEALIAALADLLVEDYRNRHREAADKVGPEPRAAYDSTDRSRMDSCQ